MKFNHNTDEKKLIAACLKADPKAQRQLYEQFAPGMMAVCFRYTGNYEVAQDLLQDGFVKVYAKLDTFKGEGAFGGWVRRVFVSTCLEYLRQKTVLHNSIELSELEKAVDDYNADIVGDITVKELMECVSALPDNYRTVFNMFAIEGYSHAEIAEMLEINENTSRSQFMRARNLLQKNIAQILGEEYVEKYRK